MPQYLFSYGTLQPALAPPEIAPLVSNFRKLGKGTIRGTLFDLGEYPGLKRSPRAGVVSGVVFEIPDDSTVLRKLDEYEGYDPTNVKNSLFIRRPAIVQMSGGERKRCWLYLYNKEAKPSQVIANGRFRPSSHSVRAKSRKRRSASS